jgi:hypothetical protein
MASPQILLEGLRPHPGSCQVFGRALDTVLLLQRQKRGEIPASLLISGCRCCPLPLPMSGTHGRLAVCCTFAVTRVQAAMDGRGVTITAWTYFAAPALFQTRAASPPVTVTPKAPRLHGSTAPRPHVRAGRSSVPPRTSANRQTGATARGSQTRRREPAGRTQDYRLQIL